MSSDGQRRGISEKDVNAHEVHHTKRVKDANIACTNMCGEDGVVLDMRFRCKIGGTIYKSGLRILDDWDLKKQLAIMKHWPVMVQNWIEGVDEGIIDPSTAPYICPESKPVDK